MRHSTTKRRECSSPISSAARMAVAHTLMQAAPQHCQCRGLPTKHPPLKSGVGQQIGSAIDDATASGITIPPTSVAARLQPPLNKAFALENGPGGMGNTAPLENYSASFRPPIQDAVANGGFTPRGLFDLKDSIAKNTNWSDPTQFNLKSVRQQQVGGLSDELSNNVPALKELNPQFQGVE